MSSETVALQREPTRGDEDDAARTTQHAAPRLYRAPLSNTWWLRNRRYTRFMVREFTAVPITLWLLSFLYGISRTPASAGSGGATWFTSPAYIAFSVVCLVFAVYHSVTWLGISGLTLCVPLGERDLSPGLVTAANFVLWGVASVAVGAALVLLWR